MLIEKLVEQVKTGNTAAPRLLNPHFAFFNLHFVAKGGHFGLLIKFPLFVPSIL
jgi:hypothetical protein